jgi:hypothetical protein
MMTGVFHFIAISFGLILAGRKLESPPTAVNQALRRTPPFGYAILSTLPAFLGMPPISPPHRKTRASHRMLKYGESDVTVL